MLKYSKHRQLQVHDYFSRNKVTMIKRHKLTLPKGSSQVILGFSGGADSTALAQLLYKNNIPFHAIHFNHHLRKNTAEKDAAFCHRFCQERSIPYTEKHIYVQKEKQASESVETCARRLRQNFYQDKYSKKNTIILLAHHSGDLRENFLLRALRGSSSSGLSGLKETSVISGVTYFRPLLLFSKNDILEYLQEQKLSWCEDESNRENIYGRNIIRNTVLPNLAKVASLDGLDHCLNNVAMDADFIEQAAKDWLKNVDFTKENFLKAHPALKIRILRYYFQNQNIEFIPGHDALKRFEQELSQRHCTSISIQLEKNICLMLNPDGKIWFKKNPYALEWDWKNKHTLELPNGRTLFANKNKTEKAEAFVYESLPEKLVIRTPQNGDRMIAFGKNSPRKIKDFFSQKKITPQMKQQWPLICANDEIIWIPGIKRGEYGRLNPNNSPIYLSYE